MNKIIHGDCLDEMRKMADKSIDLIVTDPPYGLGIDGHILSVSKNPKHDRKEHEFMGWDKDIPSKEYFDEMFRVSKNQIIWGGNYFVEYLKKGHKGWIVWDKGQHGLTMSDGELAYTSFDVPLRIFILNRCHIKLDGSHHPTMKPIELMKWCIENYSKEGDLILDPFAGSCSTLVAAQNLKRRYIGIEKEGKYIKVCNERLSATTQNLL